MRVSSNLKLLQIEALEWSLRKWEQQVVTQIQPPYFDKFWINNHTIAF